MDKPVSRRRFMKIAAVVTTAPLAATLGSRMAFAQDGEKLTEDDPTAMALGYKHNAEEVDTNAFPKRTGEGASQHCANCNLFAAANEGDEWAPCAIFQNKLVNANGWCSAWVPKA